MTQEEFMDLQSAHLASGLPLKTYLSQIGTSYSTYNYWRKKFCTSTDSLRDLAPISIRHSPPSATTQSGDMRNGDVFIFIDSSRKLMKLLHAEDGGMVMYVKRLEAGRFKLPEYDEQSNSYQMEWRDFVVMVEGIQESPGQRLRRLRAQRRE